MKYILLFSFILIFGFSIMNASGDNYLYKEQLLARVSPKCEVAGYRFEDLNGDNVNELFIIGKKGEVRTWSGINKENLSLNKIGNNWQLPFPKRSLISLSSFMVNGKKKQLLTLTPDGLFAYPISADGHIESKGVLINKRMKFRFRVGEPLFSSFLQDINQDGKLDILVPVMDHCEIWINRTSDKSSSESNPIYKFSKIGKFSVKMTHNRQTGLGKAQGILSESFMIPSLLLKDINGDKHLDLIVQQNSMYDYYVLTKDGQIPEEPTVSLDLNLFQDSTPQSKGIEFGETISMQNSVQLIESDLNNDTIPDYVIWHRRKLWFFHGTDKGPQFTDPSSIIKIAEDITLFFPCALDDDEYPDLLMIKVQAPSLAQLAQALFTDWKFKIESSGYQSSNGKSFKLSSKWKGEVFVLLPSLLSILTNPDSLMDEIEFDNKYVFSIYGDFNGDKIPDVSMSNLENNRLEVWFGKEGDQERVNSSAIDEKEFSQKIRETLFTDKDNVWDIGRMMKAVNFFINKQVFLATGNKEPDFHLNTLKGKKRVQAIPVDYNNDDQDELLFIYANPKEAHFLNFDLYAIVKKQDN